MSATLAISETLTPKVQERSGLYKVGGVSFVVVGILFLSKYLLDLSIGSPPRDGAELLAWRAAGELPIAITNEILFFAAMFLVPAVIALYWGLGGVNRVAAAIGCGVLAALIPVLMMLDIVQGRFVYPIYGFKVDTPTVAGLVLAIYGGGLHAVAIAFGVATVALSVAMLRGSFGRGVAYLGFAAAAFDVVGSYPEAIGPILTLVSQILFAAWFVAVGSMLYRLPRSAHENTPV
jgi:hypothetical protein